MKYIKVGKHPETELGKYVYDVIKGKYREGRKYVRFQLSVYHNVTREEWYKNL